MIDDIIIIVVIVLIIGFSILYLIKQKKKGRKCIGCPYSDSCSKNKCTPKNNKKVKMKI